MRVPLNELLDHLQLVDEVQILELLNIKTEEILERFEDKVRERRAYLEKELEILSDTEEDEDAEY